MVAITDAVTTVVVTEKVANVEPATTITETGTVALLVLDDKTTFVPPVGAGPFRVAVPVDGLPPTTVGGFNVILASPSGLIFIVADSLTPLRLPVMVASAELDTAAVFTVNVVDDDPAVTVTEAGTTALVMLEDNAIFVPPVGAGPLNVAVPVEGFPPTTEVGDRETLASVGGLMATVADRLTVPRLPVMVALVTVDTAVELTVKVPLV
jgi:hypothetical protein